LKQIKPYNIVLYLGGILLILGIWIYVFPEGGIQIGNLQLSYTNLEKLTREHKVEKKDIKDILKKTDTTMQVVNLDSLAAQKKDSIAQAQPKSPALTGIDLNDAARQNLYQFFKRLSRAKNKKLSILHYGDSQIESDRITSYLRQKTQLQFGGYGPGLIPATDVYNNFSFQQEYSGNFIRYTAFGGKNKLKSAKYGALASASRFTKEIDTTAENFSRDSLPEVKAWISISPSKKTYSRARVYSRVRMHYNDCIDSVQIKVFQGENLIKETYLKNDGKQHSLVLNFSKTPENLKFEFTGKISPNICGFSLEGISGVQFSNIAMRGSDGTVFKRIKYSTLSTMMHEVNTQLVLMQFGGNSVVAFKDSTQVTHYANWFKSQIQRVQKAMPGSMVIVIGPSDMSKLTDGVYETYPFLPYTVEEMKRVALESNAGFWNLYQAMGGKNSMPSWVEKRLAANDYVHFSNKGAKFAAELFWQAFINEYVKWKKQPENNEND